MDTERLIFSIGKRHRIPDLWFYFVLAEILPVSFAFSLFLLALALGKKETGAPVASAHSSAFRTKSSARPSARTTIYPLFLEVLPAIIVAIYQYCLGYLYHSSSQSALIPIVLLLRALLFSTLYLDSQRGLLAQMPGMLEVYIAISIVVVWKSFQPLHAIHLVPETTTVAALRTLDCDHVVLAFGVFVWRYGIWT